MARLLGNLRVRLTAETEDFRRGLDSARKNVTTFEKRMNRMTRATRNGVLQFAAMGAGVTSLTGAIQMSLGAANDFDRAQRKLAGTAKLTGIELSTLTGIARQAESQFSLSASVANELTSEITKLTSKAGDLSQSSAALRAFLDIGAARGLGAAQTLQAVRQAILGIDEGTDKLFGKNPSTIYKEFADSIGTTAGKLTDAQKAQALLNEAMEAGERVRGEYLDYLDSAVGKQDQMRKSLTELANTFGQVLQPAVVEFSDRLEDDMKDLTAIGALLERIPQMWEAIRVFETDPREAKRLWDDAFRQWRNESLITYGKLFEMPAVVVTPRGSAGNPVPLEGVTATGTSSSFQPKVVGGPRMQVPDVIGSREAIARRNGMSQADWLTGVLRQGQQHYIEEQRILARSGALKAALTGNVQENLKAQTSAVDRIYKARVEILEQEETSRGVSLDLERMQLRLTRDREKLQLRLNAELEKQIQHQRKIESLKLQGFALASDVAGGMISGRGVRGAQVGAGIGGMAGTLIPGVGSIVGGMVGSTLGSFFDRGKNGRDSAPVRALSAIEQAQRETISAIRQQTDSLLNPQNRLLNAPTNFSVPAYRPSMGGAGQVSNYNGHTVNLQLTVNGKADPDEVKRYAREGVEEALYMGQRSGSRKVSRW